MVSVNKLYAWLPFVWIRILFKVAAVFLSIEALFFADAAFLHAGIELFGQKESLVVSEALVQGFIGLLMILCAYGMWNSQKWSIKLALLVQLAALAGALFGSAVVREADNNLNYLNGARLIIAVVVLVLLLLLKLKEPVNDVKHTK